MNKYKCNTLGGISGMFVVLAVCMWQTCSQVALVHLAVRSFEENRVFHPGNEREDYLLALLSSKVKLQKL
jgi:hypothetical protein